jgi:ABC-2 type transport system permease protein
MSSTWHFVRATASFEVKRRLKMLSSWVYAVILFASAFILVASSGGLFSGMTASTGSEQVNVNSPHTLYSNTALLTLIAILMVASFFGQAAAQDFIERTDALIFTSQVPPRSYLLGRFIGALGFSYALLFAIPAGLAAGVIAVSIKGSPLIGAHSVLAYLWPMVSLSLPTLFFCGALFFAVAAATRKMAWVYLGMVILVLGYLGFSSLYSSLQYQSVVALVDAFGLVPFEAVTRYWTPFERNTLQIPLAHPLLTNRLLVIGFGASFYALAQWKFRPNIQEHGGAKVERDQTFSSVRLSALTKATATSPHRGVLSGGWLAFLDVLKSPIYWSFIVAGLAFMVLGFILSKELFGTATLPVTYKTLELARGSFALFVLIVSVFFAGELAFKERDSGMADVVDATPVSTFSQFAAKVLALSLVQLSVLVLARVAGAATQLALGYTHLEPLLYLSDLGLTVLITLPLGALTLALQILLNNKYLAYGAMVAFFLARIARTLLGIEERLLSLSPPPLPTYSDMNGFGEGLLPFLLYATFWLLLAVALSIVSYLFFVRGRETGWRQRRQLAARRFTLLPRAATGVTLVLASGLAGFLYYRSHVANPYVTAKETERRTARFEKTYASWNGKPQPKITAVDVKFDIHPERPSVAVQGTLALQNKTAAPIAEVMIQWPSDLHPTLTLQGAQAKETDAELGVAIFSLEPPMIPGATTSLSFSFLHAPDLLAHNVAHNGLAGNGTFMNSSLLPSIGYSETQELTQKSAREKYGLPAKEGGLRKVDDALGLSWNFLRADSDQIRSKIEIVTAADQIAIAPGSLKSDTVSNGRRTLVYESETPILNFFSILSARLSVLEDTADNVKLSIFYHPTHTQNLAHMMQGMKDALAYCKKNFGPYPHPHARIIEFPRYQSFAQSFPGTIPYSEAIGFIAQVDDNSPDDLDYPYYVTAHEIAHQWWGHQAIPAQVRGSAFISETMSQYTALMVMKEKFGPQKMRRFLKYELDRYLFGRAVEQRKESPLSEVESQAYTFYQKGSLAMYWLQDVVGEELVNRALKKYLDTVRFQGPPYATSKALLAVFKEEIPQEHHRLLTDLFETITIYDNRVTKATATAAAGGGFDVEMQVDAVKYLSSGSGEQKAVDFDDLVEVGALDKNNVALHLEKQRLHQGQSTLRFHVNERPAHVGVDPLNKLIDRTSADNVMAP